MEEVQRIFSGPRLTVRHSIVGASEFEPHSHSSLSVTLLLAGRMDVRIGESAFALLPGQIALTNVGQVHSGQTRNAEFVSAAISPLTVDQIITDPDAAGTATLRTGAEIKIIAAVIRDDDIEGVLRGMRAELGSDRLARDQMLDSMSRQVVIQLIRSHIAVRGTPNIERSRAGPVDRRLRRAIEFMHDNFARELALDEIASAAFLSEFHFARLFKQITGVTPHSYLANIRLERARKLLLEGVLPVSEIALAVGYQSQSHFTKAFKGATGMTPLVFRRGSLASPPTGDRF